MASFSWPVITSANPSVGGTGAAAPSSATEVAGVDPNGELQALSVDDTGKLNVNISSGITNPLPVTNAAAEASLSSIDTKTPALVSGRVPVDGSGVTQPIQYGADSGASFSLTAVGQNAEIDNLSGRETWTIYVSTIGPDGAMICFGSPDPAGVAFQSVPAVNVRTGATNTTISEAGLYRVNISGFSKVRLEVTALTSGSIDGIQLVSYTDGALSLNSPLPAGTNVLGGVTQSGSWSMSVSGSLPLPTGAATETTLSAINTKTPALGQAAMAASVPVAIASNQSAVPISAASLPLPTGAATEATLSAMSAKLPATLGQKTMAASMAVTLASDQTTIGTAAAGYARANAPVMNNYASSPVTTSAYTQLVLSTSSATKQVQIFDSSGQAMIFALGGVGAETDYLYVPPGGGVFNLAIASATRVSVKALTANATSGYLLVNFLG